VWRPWHRPTPPSSVTRAEREIGLTCEILLEVVATNEKKRFALSDDGTELTAGLFV
jgi:RNA:NAD 2'-phosphotransferase (TPT1/KptA family)